MELNVWIEQFDTPAGRLFSEKEGRAGFAYNAEYLKNKNAIPISVSMPLAKETYADSTTRAFFNNLLQENDQLEQIIERERIDRSDVVAILFHLGADCAGAISCLPTDAGPTKKPGNLNQDYDELDQNTIEEIVRRLANREPLPDQMKDPSPVAGVQRKIALSALPNGRYGVPKSGLGVPTTHILKVPRRVRQRDVALEVAACKLASIFGIEVSEPERTKIGDYEGVLIRRFDRVVDEQGRVSRIHQEDFAQALSLFPNQKYERRGTEDRRYNTNSISRLLDATASPVQSKQEFIALTMFNLAIGNADNHAKNHALLYDNGAVPRLAPAYDLLPTMLDHGVSSDLSFSIGEATHASKITVVDIQKFMEQFGFGKGAARRHIEGLIAPRLNNLEKASATLVGDGFKDLDDLIGRELSVLVEALDLKIKLRVRDLLPRH